MRQLTCIGKGQMEWREIPEPRIAADGQAIVRPLAVARCDIDRALVSGVIPQRGPFALGHECVGEITGLGDGVRGFEIGDRVVVSFQLCCGRCASCAAGHTANCDAYPVLSDYGMQPLSGVEYGGMLSDRILVPFANPMLQPLPAGVDSRAAASCSDNVLDGYRAVAPHLRARPGGDVLIVSHGIPSIPLYAAQAALALGAARVDFASDDAESLALAEKLGAHAIRSDFEKAPRTYPIVVDAGLRPEALDFALRSTEPEGTCQSVSVYFGSVPMPLLRLYTYGIRFLIGRCNAAALLPEVLALIGNGGLRPGEITTRVVDWEDAPAAWAEPAIKLVVTRG